MMPCSIVGIPAWPDCDFPALSTANNKVNNTSTNVIETDKTDTLNTNAMDHSKLEQQLQHRQHCPHY
jgi:hypothetical protein